MMRKILVVDEEESPRCVMRKVLSESGYEVVEAPDATQALDHFRAHSCPVVVCDLQLPDMNGLELIAGIKSLDPDTQIVVMAGYATMDSAIQALRAGAYDYIIKPLEELDTVLRTINRAYDAVQLQQENKALLQSLQQQNSELQRVNQILRDLAERDSLTGLYNHRYFQEHIAREIARAHRHDRPFSLLFLDLDHFKRYNDTHGHPQGDELLRELAGILRERLRQSDMAARYGGEEFVLVLPETPREGALIVAEGICRRVADAPFKGRERQPDGAVTISIGIATYPLDGNCAADLIERADHALYEAKQAGRNCVRAAASPDASLPHAAKAS